VTKVRPVTKVEVFPNPEALNREAAQQIAHRAQEAVHRGGRCSIVLSGGSTPRSLYSLLATEYKEQIPWADCHFFWGDERHVPPDSPESNYRMAMDAVLSRVPASAENIHRVRSENPDAQRAAEQYADEIRAFFGIGSGQFPRFDIVLLGLGPDGHTVSLFPGTAALKEREKLVVANWVEKFGAFRITMSAPLLNHAACVLFMVQGAEKAEALRSVLHGHYQPEKFPAQLIRPTNGDLLWLADEAAGSIC
jgi:6-phosphogluconolactonase